MRGMAKVGKHAKKKARELSAVGSPPQFHQNSFLFHVRSVAAPRHLVAWNMLAKHLGKTNQARFVQPCFIAALLPRI